MAACIVVSCESFKLIVSGVVETLLRTAANERHPEDRIVTFACVYVLSAAGDTSVGPNLRAEFST